jgi:hypothetical protein
LTHTFEALLEVKAESYSLDVFLDDDKESCDECVQALLLSPSDLVVINSSDFFLSAMVNDEDLEAGLPFHECFISIDSAGCLALLFLQDSKMFRRLIASMESFLRTRGFTSPRLNTTMERYVIYI